MSESPRRIVVAGVIVVLLALLWVLLWGTLSWGNVVNGLLLGLLVSTVFPLPNAQAGGRVHLPALLVLLGRFVVDLVTASAQVAWLAVRPAPPPRSSVLACPVRSSSELILTVLTEVLSLVPGSLIIDVRPGERVLYVHVLNAGDDASVAAFRARVLTTEARVIRALGAPAEIALLDQPPRENA